MKIHKENDLIFSKKDVLGLDNYLDKLISMYSAMYMKQSSFPTKSQKKFYIAYIILNQMKVSVKSKEAFDFFNKYLLIRRKGGIAVYLRRLTKKGWFKKIGDDFILPEFCTDLKSVTFTLELHNETEEL